MAGAGAAHLDAELRWPPRAGAVPGGASPRHGHRLSLTPAQKRDAQQIFRGEVPGKNPCQWCGGIHQRGGGTVTKPGADIPLGLAWGSSCPRIRKQEFHPNGNLVSIEFWRQYDETGVIWPEDAFDDEDGEGAANG